MEEIKEYIEENYKFENVQVLSTEQGYYEVFCRKFGFSIEFICANLNKTIIDRKIKEQWLNYIERKK